MLFHVAGTNTEDKTDVTCPNEADDFNSVLNFENDYSQKVLFYVQPEHVERTMQPSISAITTRSRKSIESIKMSEVQGQELQRQEFTTEQDQQQQPSSFDKCGLSSGAEEEAPEPGNSKSQGRPSKAQVETIMENFKQEERVFRERFLSPEIMALAAEQEEMLRSRTPCLATTRLYHIDHLLHTMEQLTRLRAENMKLRRRCSYLEDTRSLLVVQKDMLLLHGSKEYSRSRIFKSYPKKMHLLASPSFSQKSKHEPVLTDSSDKDPSVAERSPERHRALQRSQSVGSIDKVNIDFSSLPLPETYTRSKSQEKQTTSSKEHFFTRSEFNKRSRKIQSKIAQGVKSFLGGKPEKTPKPPDHGTVSAEELRRTNTKLRQYHSKQGVKASPVDLLKPEQRASSISTPYLPEPSIPSSPSSVKSEPTNDLAFDLDGITGNHTIMADSLKRSSSSVELTNSTINQTPKTDNNEELQSTPVQNHKSLKRRQSSPVLAQSKDDLDVGQSALKQKSSSHKVRRVSSFKFSSRASSFMNTERDAVFSLPNSPVSLHTRSHSLQLKMATEDAAKRAKAAWGLVKDKLIYTRRDSLKKKANKQNLSIDQDAGALPGGSEDDISPDTSSAEAKHFKYEPGEKKDLTEKVDAVSPRERRRFTKKRQQSFPVLQMATSNIQASEANDSGTQKRKSLDQVLMSSGSAPEVEAFLRQYIEHL